MNKFDQMIQSKIQQLNEAPVNPLQATQPQSLTTQAPTNQPGTQQTQQQPQQQQATPENMWTQALKGVQYNNPDAAVKILNTALQSTGNIAGMREFFSNLSFDPSKGFAYIKPQQQAQQGQQQAPGATATSIGGK